mgnify:CR=1 FL=1
MRSFGHLVVARDGAAQIVHASGGQRLRGLGHPDAARAALKDWRGANHGKKVDAMLRGQEDEIYARQAYADHYAPVTETGFVTNDKWGFTIGYSPDGLVG